MKYLLLLTILLFVSCATVSKYETEEYWRTYANGFESGCQEILYSLPEELNNIITDKQSQQLVEWENETDYCDILGEHIRHFYKQFTINE